VHGIDGDLYGFLVGEGAPHLASIVPFALHDTLPPGFADIMEHMSPHISIDRDAVSAFCQRHHIRRLALFGSVLRDDFGPDSDVDVLVEFQAGHVPGFNFVSIEREFSGLLHGRRVDMLTPKFLNPRIRDQVLSSAEPLYVAA
jgi:predicted nucleotidyltransferase